MKERSKKAMLQILVWVLIFGLIAAILLPALIYGQ